MEMKKNSELELLVQQAKEKAFEKSRTMSSSLGFEKKPQDDLPVIRTYGYDAKKALEETDATLARLKIAEEKKRFTVPQHTRTFVLVSTLLFLVGGVILGYMSYSKVTEEPIEIVAPIITKPTSFITSDRFIQVTLSNIPKTIAETEGEGITHIVSENTSFADISNAFFEYIPSRITRNANSEYMLGTIGLEPVENPFFIIKIPFEHTLSSMQEWEDGVTIDMLELFAIKTGTLEPFIDMPNEKHVVRTNTIITYGIHTKGYIVLSTSIDAVSFILDQLD